MDGTVFRGSNGLTPFFYGHTLNCISQAPLSGVKKKWQQKKNRGSKSKKKKGTNSSPRMFVFLHCTHTRVAYHWNFFSLPVDTSIPSSYSVSTFAQIHDLHIYRWGRSSRTFLFHSVRSPINWDGVRGG